MNNSEQPNTKKQQISSVIISPCIISFSDMPKSLKHYQDLQLLCGTVKEDYKGRFAAGMSFRSSPVVSVDGKMVTTANSLYQVEGNIDYVDLPFKQLPQVMEYIDPRQIKTLLDAGYTPIASVDG